MSPDKRKDCHILRLCSQKTRQELRRHGQFQKAHSYGAAAWKTPSMLFILPLPIIHLSLCLLTKVMQLSLPLPIG